MMTDLDVAKKKLLHDLAVNTTTMTQRKKSRGAEGTKTIEVTNQTEHVASATMNTMTLHHAAQIATVIQTDAVGTLPMTIAAATKTETVTAIVVHYPARKHTPTAIEIGTETETGATNHTMTDHLGKTSTTIATATDAEEAAQIETETETATETIATETARKRRTAVFLTRKT